MKIICVGGGTLGSVTPLLGVIEAWQKIEPRLEVEWWGTKQGPEKKLLKSLGIKYYSIAAGKLRRYWSLRNFSDVLQVGLGFVQALWRFGLRRPEVVLTAGSFVALPVGLAAKCYGLPLTLHQQDVRPSLVNKLLAPLGDLITVTWPDSLQHFSSSRTVLTGNPVRTGFLKPPDKELVCQKLGLKSTRPIVLVMGGGTGAAFLNELITANLTVLVSFCQIIHLTGLNKVGAVNQAGYYPLPLATDTASLLTVADVVVARAGMGTITELAAAAKPAIIVPLPESHQEDNAVYLERKQAAVILHQTSLTMDAFVDTLRQLLTAAPKRTVLGKNLQAIMIEGAAEKVVAEIIKMLNNNVKSNSNEQI